MNEAHKKNKEANRRRRSIRKLEKRVEFWLSEIAYLEKVDVLTFSTYDFLHPKDEALTEKAWQAKKQSAINAVADLRKTLEELQQP